MKAAVPEAFVPEEGQPGSELGSHVMKISGLVGFGSGNAFRYGCRGGEAVWRESIVEGVKLASGTVVRLVRGSRNRRPSYEKKKNVLFFRMGPLSVPPKSFWRSFGFGRPALFANQSFASKTSFRR